MATNKKPNIFLFHGADKESLQKEIQKWTQNFEQKFGAANISILKDKPTASQVFEQIQTQAFLADKRLVLVYNLYPQLEKNDQKAFLDKLETLESENILVLIEESTLRKNSVLIKQINKVGQVKEFALSMTSLKQKAQAQLQTYNKTINPFLLEKLIKNLDQNPFKIHQEIEKLALFSESSEITESDILSTTSQNEASSPFKLMDAISAKNLKQSLKLLHDLHQNREDLMRLFFLIVRQFRLLIQVKYLQEQGTAKNQIAKELKIAPFALSGFTRFSSNFTYSKLQQALEKLLKFDTDIKNGNLKYSANDPSEFLFAIEQFIMWVCE